MNYTVYLRTNTVNGKQYVGQTNNLEQRNRQFNSLKCKYNKYLDEDRTKFGVDCFKVEILAEVETREKAWALEKEFITKLGTVFPNGYNKAYGGKTNKGGNKGYHNGKEFKKGDEPWNKGVKDCFSEETIKSMSEKHKGKHNSPSTEFKKGLSPWIKGRHHTEESKEKNRQAHLGKVSSKRRPVLQFTLDWVFIKEFTHLMAAAEELGLKSDESIRKACREEWRSSCGYRWKFKDEYEEKLLEDLCSQELN